MNVIITAFAGYIVWAVLKRTSETMNADKQKAKDIRDKAMKKKEETRMLDIAVSTLFYTSTNAEIVAEIVAANEFLTANAANAARMVEDIANNCIIELLNNPTELECENAKDSKAKLDSAKAASELAVKLANIRSLDEADAHNLWGLVNANAKAARNAFIKADAAYTVAYTACQAWF
jgi:hypothetical protein